MSLKKLCLVVLFFLCCVAGYHYSKPPWNKSFSRFISSPRPNDEARKLATRCKKHYYWWPQANAYIVYDNYGNVWSCCFINKRKICRYISPSHHPDDPHRNTIRWINGKPIISRSELRRININLPSFATTHNPENFRNIYSLIRTPTPRLKFFENTTAKPKPFVTSTSKNTIKPHFITTPWKIKDNYEDPRLYSAHPRVIFSSTGFHPKSLPEKNHIDILPSEKPGVFIDDNLTKYLAPDSVLLPPPPLWKNFFDPSAKQNITTVTTSTSTPKKQGDYYENTSLYSNYSGVIFKSTRFPPRQTLGGNKFNNIRQRQDSTDHFGNNFASMFTTAVPSSLSLQNTFFDPSTKNLKNFIYTPTLHNFNDNHEDSILYSTEPAFTLKESTFSSRPMSEENIFNNIHQRKDPALKLTSTGTSLPSLETTFFDSTAELSKKNSVKLNPSLPSWNSKDNYGDPTLYSTTKTSLPASQTFFFNPTTSPFTTTSAGSISSLPSWNSEESTSSSNRNPISNQFDTTITPTSGKASNIYSTDLITNHFLPGSNRFSTTPRLTSISLPTSTTPAVPYLETSSIRVNEKKNVYGITAFGGECKNECAKRNYDYTWCVKKVSSNIGPWPNTAYCSVTPNTTSHGEDCVDRCYKRGEFYTWCNTLSSWGYCSPSSLEQTKAPAARIGFTVYGEQCKDACEYRGYKYTWCNKLQESKIGNWRRSDYCGSEKGVTVYGGRCLNECGQHEGTSYNWCKTIMWTGKWDYCTPSILFQ